jgi:hypothetical protein
VRPRTSYPPDQAKAPGQLSDIVAGSLRSPQQRVRARSRARLSIGTYHQSCTEPSRRRFTGRYFGSYGYRAAASSSNVTPRPG